MLLGLVLLAPLVAADRYELPTALDLSETPIFEGQMAWGVEPVDPVIVGMTSLDGEGTWTSCPVDAQQGLVDLLLALAADCPDGQSFDDPRIRLQVPLDAQLAGTYQVPGEGNMRMATSANRMMVWQWNGPQTWNADDLRMAPLNDGSAVAIQSEGDTYWFNGTSWLFLYESTSIAWSAGTAGCGSCGVDAWSLSDARERMVVDPYQMLKAQVSLMGEGSQQNRSALARSLSEYGALPNLVSGTVRGILDGEVGGWRFVGLEPALVRYEGANFLREEGAATTDGEAVLVLRGSSVGGSEGPAGNPVWISAILWIVAGIVLAFRRHVPGKVRWQRSIQWGGVVLLALVADLLALSILDSGLLLPPRPISLYGFTASLVVLGSLVAVATLLYVLPLRSIGRRLLPATSRWTWITDALAWLIVLVSLALLPYHFLGWSSRFVHF